MKEYFQWFDPHEARKIADAAPMKIAHARSEGMASGLREAQQFMRTHVFEGILEQSRQLGRKTVQHPNFSEAVERVVDALSSSSDFHVRFDDEPHSMSKMVFQEVNVRPFRIHCGTRFSIHDLHDRRFA